MDAIQQINIEQLVISALTLTAAGVVGFWCKDMPLRVWYYIVKQCTTTIYLTSAHNAFYQLVEFLETNYGKRNFRTFKLTNGKWGHNDITTIGIGYGGHFIRFENLFMHIHLGKEQSNATVYDKETIVITKLGRNRKDFEKFFKVISTDKERENNIQIYKMNEYWHPMNLIPKRTLDTVFLEQHKKDILLKTIDDFVKEEQWYLDNGIPYHLGILLYGSPGTGKSSLIKAIASYLSYDIYYLPVSNLSKLNDCMDTLPEKSILVIEDIDCEKALHHRTNRDEGTDGTQTQKRAKNAQESNDELSFVNFSDVLNVIDGVCSAHGRILITTTNHIDKLDPALIRPGRIDLRLELGHVTREVFNQFTKRFFDKNVGENIALKDELTCAELQSLLLQKKSYEDIITYARCDGNALGYLEAQELIGG